MITEMLLLIRKIRLIGLLALAVSLWGVASPVTTVLAADKPPEIRAGFHRNFPPGYVIDEATGKPAGFAAEVMNEVARIAGLEIRYLVFDDWPQINNALLAGRIDIVPNMGITEERKRYADFTSPVGALNIRIFVRETALGIRGLADLQDRNVAVVDFNAGQMIMREYGKGRVVVFNSLEEASFSLLSGKTDALIYPEQPVLLIARKSGVANRIKAVGAPLVEVKRAIAVKKGEPALLAKLDRAVQLFIATPKCREIYAKWHFEPEPYWSPRRVAIIVGIFLLLLIIVIAIAHHLSLRRLNRDLQSSLERQKSAEALLQKSEMRYRHLVESSHDLIWEVDENGVYTYVSPLVKELLGYESGEVLGKTPFDLMPEKEAGRVKALFADIAAGRQLFRNFENCNRHKDGTLVILETNGSPIIDESGAFCGYRGMDRDITERKRAEEDRQRLAAAIEQSGETVVIVDKEGIIQYVNPAFERTTGYTRAEAVGKNPRILQSGRQDIDFYKSLWSVLTAGGTWKGHFVNKKKDGSLYEEDATISPVRNLSGEVIHYVAVKRDVTEKLKTERQLLQAQKLEAIGTMAGGIAHDFNNILGAIAGYTELSLAKIPPESRIKHYLEQIQTSSQRAISLVRQILEFSRLTEKDRKPIRLIPLIKETVKMLKEIIPSTIAVRLNIRTGADAVLGDATQIYQVLMNLCTNAYQAMKDKGGQLEIELLKTEAGGDIEDSIQGLTPGSYVEIIIRDTGTGIDPLIRKRIFDPFFTTKKIGEGTGLGLSVVHGIVRSCGGKITVESRVDEGSAFHVYLPLLAENPEASSGELPQPLGEGKGRILLVDDEEMLVDMARETLEGYGYTVLAWTDSVQALEAFRAHPEEFDLVVTDQTMPVMTGIELARNIVSIRPDMPIILCTGFIDSTLEEKATAAKIREVILKPVVIRGLIAKMQELLPPAG
ncbi:MAG: PAS domain S-box protein [Syntrophobacterales bacterium]|nr:PAS domain S-box protein [Syntrophobacterales bacterium]